MRADLVSRRFRGEEYVLYIKLSFGRLLLVNLLQVVKRTNTPLIIP